MNRLARGLLLFLCALAPFGLASAQKGEELALFKRFYSSARSAAERKEAVLTLRGLADPGVFPALYARLGDKATEPDVAEAIVELFAGFRSAAQEQQVYDALKSEKAEALKSALLQAIARARWPERAGIVALQLSDKSWEVRRRALDALLALGDPLAAEKVAPLCDDASDVVRFKALDTLAGFRSALVVPRAIARLEDASRQVRHSAIHALAVVRDKASVEPLVQRMRKEPGLLLLDLGETLASLTGQELGPDPERWAHWWAAVPKEGYEIPEVAAVAFLRGSRAARSGAGGSGMPETKPSGPVFPPLTQSRLITFVIDCSGSMEALVTERERYAGGDYPDFSRMEIVKAELMRVIDRLPANVRFGIIAFATDVMPWKTDLQPANIVVKFAAKEWVKRLHAIGGAAQPSLAIPGLPGANAIEKGRTNTFDALREALRGEADTVFFLSDGRPTAGPYVEPEDILREVRKLNELRKVVIHTIGIGEFDASFMLRLAQENGPGQFTDLGK